MNLEPARAIRLADAIEASACRDLYAAAPAALEVRTEVVAGATLLLAPEFPLTYLNRVIGLGVEQTVTEADLDAVIDAYRVARVRDFWIHLTPTAQSPALARWLERRGFVPPERRSWAKFLRGPEPLPSFKTDLQIRTAARGDAPAAAQIVCAAFGMPPALAPWFEALVGRPGWQVFLATADGIPAATASVHIGDGAAWLGIGATLPAFRNRGAQTALLAARIRAAAEAGCTILSTETGEPVGGEPNPSFANILRCGFTQVCSRLNYAPSSS